MTTYLWTITEQGGSSSNYNVNPVAFVLDNPAVYDVTLTVTNPGGSSSTTEVGFLEVFANPVVDYTVTSAPYCAPVTVEFTSVSLPGSDLLLVTKLLRMVHHTTRLTFNIHIQVLDLIR